jgi:ABC-2 type transport system ATP-binding protein
VIEPTPPAPPEAASAAAVVAARALSKVFKDDTGVHELDLTIPPGTIFGFVGPSGSGKTTTVRMLTGLTRPTSGSVEVLGSVPTRFSSTTKSRIGYLPQLSALYPQLTVRQNLTFAASIAGLPWLGRSAALRRVIEFVELEGSESKTVTEISGGMQRRLGLAATLVHDPELLFLDEPTAGIDPVLRRKFWDHFAEMRDEGRTVFVTTQYVGEAEYCDLVALIVGGRLVMMDTPEALRRAASGGDLVRVRFATVHGPETIEELSRFDGDTRVRPLDERSLELVVPDAARAIPDLVSWAQERGLDLEEAEEHRPPFDDVFVTLVERARDVETSMEMTGAK